MKKNTYRDYKSKQLAAVLKENIEKNDSSINKARLIFGLLPEKTNLKLVIDHTN